ncbi:hypothetical protein M8J75_010471 [Diaphorina citri]|nr:hypothetical protein M8J75_010471 [Diaphorina citri]
MVQYGSRVSQSLTLVLILIGISQGSPEREAKFLALDKLKSRYVDTPLYSLPFFRPLWHSKSSTRGGVHKNNTGETAGAQSSITQNSGNQSSMTPSSVTSRSPLEETTVLSTENKEPNGPYDYSCPPCWCGVPNRMDRIVGGWTTEVNEYPWVVALEQAGKFFCGGTLISDRYVLTAAHCVRSSKRHKDLIAVISEHNRATVYETQIETRRVVKVLTHPKYNAQGAKSHDHDIALLKLDAPLEFKPTVSPVCLPQLGEKFTQRTGTVVGWGRVEESGQIASDLRATQVPVMSNQECRQFPGFEPKLTGNMMCAGYVQGGKDSCQGDSGGALLMEDLDGRFLIAGVVSWGIGCARPNSPGVYTRVNHYMEWIQNNTRDACFCF